MAGAMLMKTPVMASLGVTSNLPRRMPTLPALGLNKRPVFSGFGAPTHIQKDASEVVCDAAALGQTPVLPQPGVLPPPAVYQKLVEAGEKKGNLPAGKIFIMGIVAGVFIAFGALLALSVGGTCPGLVGSNPGMQKLLLGVIGLPFGLFLVLNCGVELFTGNTALLAASVLEGKSTMGQLVKSWIFSYFGNLVGCLLAIAVFSAAGVTSTANPAIAIATAKTSLPFMQAFLRGILANWLVCLAIWMATASSTMSGKVLGIFIPISSFVAMGFEHSVANMFFIPFGIKLGAGLSFATFCTTNLIPVTLGNIVGGAVCLAMLNSLFFGKLGENM